VDRTCSSTCAVFFEQLRAPILHDGPSLIVEGERVTHLRYTIRRP